MAQRVEQVPEKMLQFFDWADLGSLQFGHGYPQIKQMEILKCNFYCCMPSHDIQQL